MPQFQIYVFEPGQEPRVFSSSLYLTVFDSGADAATMARHMSDLTGIKHQPRPIKSDEDWRAREQSRLDNGTYKPLPWISEPWFKRESTADHFAHVSFKDASKIAFSENESKGEADIQATMKPGRYLRTFYGDVLDANQITEATRVYAAYTNTAADNDSDLLFAKTADEIEDVYLNGPDSCMSHAADDYATPFHPVRVYAGFDLAVAYCKDESGNIIARSLCWPDRKIYGRIYPEAGDANYKITELLRREGFSYDLLTGARFTRTTSRGNIVCPYIDRIGRATDCGSYMEIGDTGNGTCHVAESTCGWLEDEEDDRPTCDSCGERYDEGTGYYAQDVGSEYCEFCADNSLYTCEATGQHFRRERSVVTLSDGTIWSRDYFDDHGAQCGQCGDNERADDIDENNRCANCPVEIEDEEDEATPSDQGELPLAGTFYRIAINRHGEPEHGEGLFVVFDGRSQTTTESLTEARRLLAEMSALYPRITYTLETIPARVNLAA